MKKILFILCMLWAVAYGQYTPMTAFGYQFKYIQLDSGMAIPLRDTIVSRGVNRAGLMVYKSGNGFYGYTGTYWKKLLQTGDGTATLQSATDNGPTTTNNFSQVDGGGNPLVSSSNETGSGTLTVTDSTTGFSAAHNSTGTTFQQGGNSLAVKPQATIGGTYDLYYPNVDDTLAVLSDIPSGYYDNGTGIYYRSVDSTVYIDTTRLGESIVNWRGLRDTLATAGATAWKLTGNGGTTAGTNFIGTTDNIDLIIKRNNFTSGRIGLLNTAFGYKNLSAIISGDENTAFGSETLAKNTNGSNNTGVGTYTLYSNLGGGQNTGVGETALYSNTSGAVNTAIGMRAMFSNLTASDNTAIGADALYSTTGANNTAVGSGAGQANVSGTNNTFLGKSANALVNNLSNATAIGANAKVRQSNTISLGDTSIVTSVGIGDNNPDSLLTVGGGVHIKRGLRANIPSGVGTKVVRFDLSTQTFTYADTSAGVVTTKQTDTANVTITNGVNWFISNPYAALTAQTLTTPASPTDGQEILISFGGHLTANAAAVVNTFTLTANSGQTIIGQTVYYSLGTNDKIRLKYNLSNTSWYK
jgi:hypothetical protein